MLIHPLGMFQILLDNTTYTTLNSRKLWIDGDNTIINKNLLYDLLLAGFDISTLYVETIDNEIKFYNRNNENTPLKIKEHINPLNMDWNIPDNYKNIKLRNYILNKLYEEVNNNEFSDNDIKKRVERVEIELQLWDSNNLNDLLKTLIYIIDNFKENNIVWGTGRGSSCCCYILYLIGLHDVDSIFYELDITEFFR